MMCYPPTDYIMISFKEVKIFWRPGAGDSGPGARYDGLGPDNPNTL